MRPLEIPEFGRLLAPVIGDLGPAERPAFLAMLERTAAQRYRSWAEQEPLWREELLACAAREDEIADRVSARFSVEPDVSARLEALLPGAREIYFGVFEGLNVREQLGIQAAAERQGANAWRSVSATPGLSAAVLAELAACSALEETTADAVDALLV